MFVRDGALFGAPFDLDELDVTGGSVALVDGVDSGVGSDAAQFELSDTGVLVYVARGGFFHDQSVLGLVDREGNVEILELPPARYSSPRWSPDGTKLVVQRLDDNVDTLWIHDLSGSRAMQQLTFEGYAVRIDTEPEFAVSDARTISPGRFVFKPRAREWDIAPDGETLVMVFPEASTAEDERIHIVLNWFEELKAKVPVNRRR